MYDCEVAVLEIASDKMRVAVADCATGDAFRVLGIGESNYLGCRNGKWDAADAKRAIKAAVRQAEANTSKSITHLYVGLPAPFYTTVTKDAKLFFERNRIINNSDITALLDRNNVFEDDTVCESIAATTVYYVVDGKRLVEPRGMELSELKALATYTRCEKSFMYSLRCLFDDLGFKVQFVPAMWATGMYLFDAFEREKYVLLAKADFSNIELAFMRSDGVLYSAAIPYGGMHIIKDIASVFGISPLDAEHLLTLVDLDYPDPELVIEIVPANYQKITVFDVADVIVARLEDMAQKFKSVLACSQYECPEHLKLYLTGSDILNIKGAVGHFAKFIGRSIEVSAPKLAGYNKPEYSVLLGLINAAAKDQKDNIVVDTSKGGILGGIKKLFKK